MMWTLINFKNDLVLIIIITQPLDEQFTMSEY